MKGKSESEVAQSGPTLSDRMVCSLPGSSVHGIFEARVLEWGAIAFSVMCVKLLKIVKHYRIFLNLLIKKKKEKKFHLKKHVAKYNPV